MTLKGCDLEPARTLLQKTFVVRGGESCLPPIVVRQTRRGGVESCAEIRHGCWRRALVPWKDLAVSPSGRVRGKEKVHSLARCSGCEPCRLLAARNAT